MIQFIHEEKTPPGGWHYIHPQTGQEFHGSVIWVMRDKVEAHCKANGIYFSETEFREIVARCTPAAKVRNRQELGDMVAVIAQPIAEAIDRIASTVGVPSNVKGCGGCKKRRDKLNKLSERMRA